MQEFAAGHRASAGVTGGLTPLERFVRLFRIPYPLAVLVIGLIGGPPIYYAAQFLARGTTNFVLEPFAVFQDILYYAVLVYPYFALRYVRRKILAAKTELLLLAPDGEETYTRTFRHVERSGPVLALTAGLLATTWYGFPPVPSAIEGVAQLITLGLAAFGFASIIWVYASSLWGLYALGTTPLRLKPYYEDALLGARVMGSLSLTLAFAYFGGMFIVSLLFISNPVFLALLVALCLVGGGLFFLPLVSIHRRMLEAQRLHRAQLGADFRRLLASLEAGRSETEGATLADVKRILAHDILDRKAHAASTWPFDTGVLSQFTVVIVSVIAILLARISQIAPRL